MSRTRVLLWHWGRRGGGPRYTLELARVLAQHPQLDIHLSLSRQSELFAETTALGLPGWHPETYTGKASAVLATLKLPGIRRALGRYLRQQQIQLVNCTMSHLWNLPVLPALKAAGVQYLLTLHDATPHPGENFLVRQGLLAEEIRRTDGIITLTDHVQTGLVQVYGYPKQQIWKIPLGVFDYHAQPQMPRVYPSGRSLRLLFFGRILPYKGLSLLLEAFPQVQQRFPALELAIVGQGDLGPYASQLQGLTGVRVENRWLQETEIGSIFAAADLVVLPYVEASQSGVVAIALATGLPMVATPVGGLLEQLSDRQTGLIAREVSATSLAAAILELLETPALYEHCSRQALAAAASSFSWPAIGAEVASVFQTMVSQTPAPNSASGAKF